MFEIFLKLQGILFYTVCITLCSYQLFDILMAYLSYETSISIDYENTSEISLPGITICFDKYYIIIREELIKSNISEEIRSDRWRLMNYFNYELTFKEQNQLLLSKNEIFTNACKVIETIGVENKNRENQSYLYCEQLSLIIELMDYKDKCFSIFNQAIGKQETKNFKIDYGTRIFSDLYVEIIIFQIPSYIRYATLYFHRRTEQIQRYSENNQIVVDLKENTTTEIFYKKTTVKLLPSPFKTDCHEFGDANSRQSCVAICRRDEMIRRLNMWPDVYYSTGLSSDLIMYKIMGQYKLHFRQRGC